jgi:hypothetical protein
MTLGPTPSITDVGVALEERHHAGEVVHDLALLGRAEDVEQAALGLALERLGQALEAVVEQPGGLDDLGQPADLLVEVVAHPRHRGELHAVGLLVQADPEPEVGGVGVDLALDVDDVGRDQQQPARRGVERVELPEHLAAEEAQHGTDLGAVTREPTALVSPLGGPFLAVTLSTKGVSNRSKLSVLARIQPGRSTTRSGACGVGRRPARCTRGPGLVERAGVLAELGDHGVGLRPADLGAGAGEPRGHTDGDLPVDHVCCRHAPNLPTGAYRAVATAEGGRRSVERALRGEGLEEPHPVGHQHEGHGGAVEVGGDARPGCSYPAGCPSWRGRAAGRGRGVGEAVLQRSGEARDRQSGEHGTQRRLVGDAATLSTPRRVAGGSRLSRDSPLPSYQTASPTGTSSSVRASRTPSTPPWNDPSPRVASPTWWASTSAASLSLTVSVRSTICRREGPWTSASGVAPPAARRRTG